MPANGRIPLASALPPGGTWTGVIPVEVLEHASPGMLLLRLEVAASLGAPAPWASAPRVPGGRHAGTEADADALAVGA
mgnify:CR=1 FL=1